MRQILFDYLLFHARFCSCRYSRHRLSAMFMAGKDPFPFCKLPLHTNDCVLSSPDYFSFHEVLFVNISLNTYPTSILFRKAFPVSES